MTRRDTIAAISTPAGVGGIAVVRLSGPEAPTIASVHLSRALAPRKTVYCRFDDIDDIIAVYYPRGYSGEPTVELSCHGSLYVQEAIMKALVDSGARMAERGEFTMRAFLNGRMNLSQAEAVADLIDSVTPAQHQLAVSQLRGGYAAALAELRKQLLDLTSLLELELDFSQEDVEFADRTQLRQLLSRLTSSIVQLTASFAMGNALKRGIPVAIVGAPNAGKSTLLNALLNDDRAIVSAIPGTTRDTIEEPLTIDGVGFRIIDTAGLRHTDDTIEALGVERSRKAMADATVVICVHDATDEGETVAIPEETGKGKHIIHVLNKTDLVDSRVPAGEEAIPISAKTGDGIDALKRAMVAAVSRDMQASDSVMVSNQRHYEALVRVQQALQRVQHGLDDDIPTDLVAVDLRDALYHLGTITGEVANNEILGNIFSRFCVGK